MMTTENQDVDTYFLRAIRALLNVVSSQLLEYYIKRARSDVSRSFSLVCQLVPGMAWPQAFCAIKAMSTSLLNDQEVYNCLQCLNSV